MIYPAHTLVNEGVYHSQLDDAGKMPVALFLPQSYEPRYPYPLLVFLHGYGQTETQWIDAVPALSRRNYICIGLRGPNRLNNEDGTAGYGWGRNRRCDGAIEDYVFAAVHETMRVCHIHSERIFLAGICEGATIAYRMALSFPEKFAGMIALNGWMPPGPMPPCNIRARQQLRVFIGHGIRNRHVPRHRAVEAQVLLHSTGLEVDRRDYNTDHRLAESMLRDVDRWLIDLCHLPA